MFKSVVHMKWKQMWEIFVTKASQLSPKSVLLSLCTFGNVTEARKPMQQQNVLENSSNVQSYRRNAFTRIFRIRSLILLFILFQICWQIWNKLWFATITLSNNHVFWEDLCIVDALIRKLNRLLIGRKWKEI